MTAQASGREIDESRDSLAALCLVGEGEEDNDAQHSTRVKTHVVLE